MIKKLIIPLFLMLAEFLAFASVSPAEDSYACAVIRNTNTHSVVLRESDSTESKLLLRLNPYEIIIVAPSDNRTRPK